MRVYRVLNNVNRYQYFLPEQEHDWEKLNMDCTSRAKTWVPPAVYIYKPLHKAGEFYQFDASTLITSPRATEILAAPLEMAGELLPLPYRSQVFTILNITECINCLDQNNTQWIYDDSGEIKIQIAEYVFNPSRFSESMLFKLPETCKGEVLLVEGLHSSEDEFRYLVEQNGLEGLVFEEIWSNE